MSSSTLGRVGSLVRFSHTIFALPFALAAVVLAIPHGDVTFKRVALIVLCIAAARTAAMAFNRLVDRHFDAQNPRTAEREIPAGVLSVSFVRALVIASCVVFVIGAWILGPLPLLLSPVALALALGYSYTKRFTPLCHLVLGAAVAFAPGGAWIAAGAPVGRAAWLLVAAVGTWVAGFDILYALQDREFDRGTGLRSIPASLGVLGSLVVSAALHLFTAMCLLAVGLVLDRGVAYFVGVGVVSALLMYEHAIVTPSDLGRLDKAFFDLNGYVSVAFLVCVLVDHFVV